MLRRAFVLAEKGRGTTSPNPMVGCVIVADGVIVGEGYHERAGGPHAEVVALADAGPSAAGATAYVTLEPCNHFGKTPPCTSALLDAGIARVVIGMPDPNADVSGGGAEYLRSQGIQVEFATDSTPFAEQNEAWLKRMDSGLPWVRVKLALTVDARASMRSRRRSKITGTGGSAITRRLRAASTAVAVGAATVDVDDPRLTVRDDQGVPANRQPLRVVVSRTSVPPLERAVFSQDPSSTLLLTSSLTDEDPVLKLQRLGVGVSRYEYRDGIRGALRTLASAGIDDVLIEAGPGLLSALWTDRLIDELIVVQAGGMAGNAAPPLYLGSADAAGYDLAPPMKAVESGISGNDAVVVWRPLDEKILG